MSGDCYNSSGVFAYIDGSRYEGSFQNGKPDGYGTFIYPNGDRHTGAFRNGAPHGRGSLLLVNNASTPEGTGSTGEYRANRPPGKRLCLWRLPGWCTAPIFSLTAINTSASSAMVCPTVKYCLLCQWRKIRRADGQRPIQRLRHPLPQGRHRSVRYWRRTASTPVRCSLPQLPPPPMCRHNNPATARNWKYGRW
ncbi:MAG: hypothetical protein H6559_28065 [Lewinellaceae bacterium]|nr:hypothetical protein [Lewinellaceae bacterium]